MLHLQRIRFSILTLLLKNPFQLHSFNHGLAGQQHGLNRIIYPMQPLKRYFSQESEEKIYKNDMSGNMVMLFTCKICSTRVGKTFSKLAYRTGVVIIQCPGCQTRHLVADHLGWFKHIEGKNVEDYLKLKNERLISGDVELNKQDAELLLRELTQYVDTAMKSKPSS
jgi:protein import protein ZIM17